MPVADDQPRAERTSVILHQLLSELSGDRVTVEHIVLELRRRSFGGLFILLAVIGLLPGLSFFAGLAMLPPAFQMAIGLKAPVLPGFVRRRELDVATVTALGNKVVPWIERLEQFIRPRWLFLTLRPMPNLLGIAIFVLALVLMVPLPLSNLPPAIALLCLSLGLIERDGLLISVGLIAGLAAFALGIGMAVIAVEAVAPVFQRQFD